MQQHIRYSKFAIVTGTGEDNFMKILAFDRALQKAGVHQVNLIPVSSILAERSKKIRFKTNLIKIGEMVHCILSRLDGIRGESVFAGLGYAIGIDKINRKTYGFVLEGHSNQSGADLRKRLILGLDKMAQLRKFTIKEKGVETAGIEQIRSKFGSAVVILIYR